MTCQFCKCDPCVTPHVCEAALKTECSTPKRRPHTCSRCKKEGHTVRTCKEAPKPLSPEERVPFLKKRLKLIKRRALALALKEREESMTLDEFEKGQEDREDEGDE